MSSRRMVRVELTEVEARALLTSNGHTEAGGVSGIFSDGTEVNAFERADRKIRDAVRSVQR
jgi:hypothetical protein